MIRKLMAIASLSLLLPAIATAQGSDRGQAKRERAAPPRPTPRVRGAEEQAQRNDAMARRQRAGNPWIPARPLVLRDGKRWVGPVYARNAFRLEHPWQYGRFDRGVGSRYLWQLKGGNRERFGLGGGWFALAPADYINASEWRWDVDEVVIYPDTDHDGWYLAYNTRLGTWSHVRFLGY